MEQMKCIIKRGDDIGSICLKMGLVFLFVLAALLVLDLFMPDKPLILGVLRPYLK